MLELFGNCFARLCMAPPTILGSLRLILGNIPLKLDLFVINIPSILHLPGIKSIFPREYGSSV